MFYKQKILKKDEMFYDLARILTKEFEEDYPKELAPYGVYFFTPDCLENEPLITDIRERDEIQSKLVQLFKGDTCCNNLRRIFYGGNCQYFYNPYFYTYVEKVKRIRISNPS